MSPFNLDLHKIHLLQDFLPIFSPSLIHPAKYGLIIFLKYCYWHVTHSSKNPAVLIYFLCPWASLSSEPSWSVAYLLIQYYFSLFLRTDVHSVKLVSSLPFSYPLTLKFCQNKYLCFVHKCIPSTLYIPSGCSIIIYGLIPCSFTP